MTDGDACTRLAALHARCFTVPRPWNAAEFAGFLADPTVFLCTHDGPQGLAGFAVGRVAADEAELLTIAVLPGLRRAGHGRALVRLFEAAAVARGARSIFLEVAAGNAAALALYRGAGFRTVGRRRGYYAAAAPAPAAPPGRPDDALVMRRDLDPGVPSG